MVENNPFPQSPPDSLRDIDEILFDYLQEQATMLRTFNDQVLYGQVILDEGELTRFYTEALYPLGSTASVLHSTLGPMLIQFVRYDRMSATTPLGHPVGISTRNPDAGAWFVTNDIKESTPENALGLMGGTRLPLTGEFGWVIIQGPNPFSIVLKAGLNTSLGMGFVWIDDGNEGALDDWAVADGALLGKQVVLESFTSSIPAGSLVLTSDANSVSAVSQGLQVQLTQLSLDLDGTNVIVSTNKIAQVDGDTALGIRIDEIEVSSGDNTAAVTVEREARITGDAILASSIETLETSVGSDIAAAVSVETLARIDGDSAVAQDVTSLDVRLSGRIDTNQETSANATTAIEALVTENTANVESTTRLEASLKEGSAENLLETNSESVQIGPLEYSTQILLSSVGLTPNEAISFGGRIFDPAPHNALSTGWQIEFFDLLNNSLGTVDSNLVSFSLLEVGEFTADSTLITADSTFFNASMAGPSHRQVPKRENILIPAMAFSFSFRSLGGTDSADTEYGPVTLVRGPVFRAVNKVSSFATATESLSARVTVNEGGIISNANATTALAVTVTDNETDIGTNASAIVTLDVEVTDNTDDLVTAFARWAVTLDVNGRVTGLELVSTLDTQSAFRVLVDKFQVFNGSTDEAVFEVNGGVAQMKAANIANLNAGKITTGELIADRISIDGLTLSRSGNNLIIKSAGVDTAQLKNASVTNESTFTLAGPLTMNTVPPATTIIFNQNFVKQEGTTSKLKVEFGCTSTTGAPVAFKNDPGLQFLLDSVVKRNFLVPNPQVTIGNDWTWIIEGLSAATYNIKVTGSDDVGVPFTVDDCYMIITETKK